MMFATSGFEMRFASYTHPLDLRISESLVPHSALGMSKSVGAQVP